MKAETRAQDTIARAQWYGIALMCPQKQPKPMSDEYTAYCNRYGVTPDSPESAPWLYQVDPTNVTPWTWIAPVTVLKGQFYDPRTGEVLMQGSKPDNNLDPTSPTFVEPPELPPDE